MRLAFTLIALGASLRTAVAGLPDKIYGVNLGSWLLLEPWMLQQEWIDMGGEKCDDCSQCIMSEFAFAQAYPTTVDYTFKKHWETWFTQDDVNRLRDAGINTVRIPLGYWLVEPLVDRTTEFYPRGGILQLRRGLKQLKAAGIKAILDHHALPGVHTANQMFAGRCTSDVQFYTDHNYHRALIWTAVMTAITHVHPDFSSVISIEAVNEPIMDASQTPGYGEFQKNFVDVVRATELILGVPVPNMSKLDLGYKPTNITEAMGKASGGFNHPIFNPEVVSVLKDAIPVMVQVLRQLGLGFELDLSLPTREPLYTSFMDVNWQHNDPPNPADAANGPQFYDNHLYYSFGGVADPNPDAYLAHLCNLDRVQNDAAVGNDLLVFGEWSLSTNFNATDEFLIKWADAQKLIYSQGKGWMFWSFKISGDPARQWSYFEGLDRGYFTQDPSELQDPTVCDLYRKE